MSKRALALLLCSGCGDRALVLTPPWSDDRVAIVVVLAEDTTPIGEPKIQNPDGVLDLELDRDQRLRVLLLTYPTLADGGPDFERCGVAIGGAGQVPDQPIESWISRPIDGDTDSIELMLTPAPATLDLRMPKCSAEPVGPCDRALLRPVSFEVTGNFREVVMPSDDAAFVILEDDGFVGKLYRWNLADDQFESIDLEAEPLSLASDRGGTTLVGLAGGRAIELAESGAVIRTVDVPVANPRLEVGEDGTAIVFGEEGAFEIVATATVPVSRPDLPAPLADLLVVSADRMLAVVPGALVVRNGATWSEEHRDIELGAGWFGFGDRDRLGVIGQFRLLLREEAEWSLVAESPTARFIATGAAFLDADRIVAIGETGYVGLVDHGSACKIESGTLRQIRGLAIARNRSFAVVVGENDVEGTLPFIARVDLSQLQ